MCEIDWAMLLEYIKVLFSWPPVIAILLFWFTHKFSQQISDLLTKIRGVKLPGGSELVLSETERLQEKATSPSIVFPESSSTPPPEGVGTTRADISLPSPSLEASGGPSIDFNFSKRAKGLFPNVDIPHVVKWMHQNPGPAFDDYIDKIFQLHCERTFGIIFGTQVDVLELLAGIPKNSPTTGAALFPIYERHITLTGKSERSLHDFLGFLSVRGLIENTGSLEGPLYQITQGGREFLTHIKQYYPGFWSSKAY